MKFCVDCKYYHLNESQFEQEPHICTRVPENSDTHDLVTGRKKEYTFKCGVMRGHESLCGREAKYWEAKDGK